MSATHYDTLEVSPKASAEVIRAAYKSLMQRHHPDKQGDAANHSDRATHIAQAYAVLSDPVQRAAYDQMLLLPSLPALSAQGMAAPVRTGNKSNKTRTPPHHKAWYGWYAWALIATILVVGGFLLSQPKKRADTKPAAGDVRDGTRKESRDGTGQATTTPLPLGAAPTLPSMGLAETPAQVLARTVLPYALDLSVDLPSVNRDTGATGYVLTIAELGLRVSAPEPLRWVQKIETQRQDILRQLLMQLASARVDELSKPEADLYLKGLIASTVAKAIGLPTNLPATPPLDPTLLTSQPIEVLLPQGFRLR